MKTDIRSNRDLAFCVSAIIIAIALLVAGPHAASAQQPATITATGTITQGVFPPLPLTITFPPAGGKVIGSVNYQGIREADPAKYLMECPWTYQLTLEGTFAGADGGSASGTADGSVFWDCSGGMTGVFSGPWSGNFYANGTGNGVFDLTSTGFGTTFTAQDPWQVTFSAEEFQAALGQSDSAPVAPEDSPSGVVTSETIYNTYGIKVEDSFGDDKWAKKAWSDEELVLLNDVLKELPPELIRSMAVTTIVRNGIYIDPNGNPKPTTFGVYNPCDGQPLANCDGTAATVRIFDFASHPFDFANDPNGEKEFKATILHELTHALQANKEDNDVYRDPAKQLVKDYVLSPLAQNYMDATRPTTDMNEPGFWQNNGWNLVLGKWTLTGAQGNQTPTDYARTNPKEDLSESVMMYVYDPQKLQTSSVKRYNFIRDQIFGGIEYEDGHQKQP